MRDTTPLTEREQLIGRQILKEIRARLGFLVDVGLDYLTLNRSATTLSGGEAQRIRLATQIGSSLMGVLYVLDEPSIGLHQRDNARLIRTLVRLRDLGNTLIVVEHDEDTMQAADHIIDMGPGAGEHGGYVVAAGHAGGDLGQSEVADGPVSVGQALDSRCQRRRREGNGRKLMIRGARENNLKNIDVAIPLGGFVVGDGRLGIGQELADQRDSLQAAGAATQPGARAARRARWHRGRGASG